MSEGPPPLDPIFRREVGPIVSGLTRWLGVGYLDVAEDAAQDACYRALQRWKYDGVPRNPGAWLNQTARRRAIDLLRGDAGRLRRSAGAAELDRLVGLEPSEGIALRGSSRDAQLRMMFSCCDAALPIRSQVAVILKLLCGFGIREISNAYLESPAATKRRISRAKAVIRGRGQLFDITPGIEWATRLRGVHTAIYLLFNEGYHGSHVDVAVRKGLCAEAARLSFSLLERTDPEPSSLALAALLCFHGARLDSRVSTDGQLITLAAQDRSMWDRNLIVQGVKLLTGTTPAPATTAFQLEAAIAGEHCMSPSYAQTPWRRIVDLYDALAEHDPSPIVRLNGAVALGELGDESGALLELELLTASRRLADYPFLPAAIGELSGRVGDRTGARRHLARAISLARNEQERASLQKRAEHWEC